MSAKEKELLNKISGLPEPLQDKFLAMANGATMALDALSLPGAADKCGKETAHGRNSPEPN